MYSGEKGTIGSKLNNISLIYDLLTVFLRNRTKGPETQIEDKAARLKKISNLSATNKGH